MLLSYEEGGKRNCKLCPGALPWGVAQAPGVPAFSQAQSSPTPPQEPLSGLRPTITPTAMASIMNPKATTVIRMIFMGETARA